LLRSAYRLAAGCGGRIARPKPRRGDIHGQYPIGEGCLDVIYPSLEASSRCHIDAAPCLDAFAQFAQGQDAEKQSSVVGRREKGDDPGIGAKLASFRNQVGI